MFAPRYARSLKDFAMATDSKNFPPPLAGSFSGKSSLAIKQERAGPACQSWLPSQDIIRNPSSDLNLVPVLITSNPCRGESVGSNGGHVSGSISSPSSNLKFEHIIDGGEFISVSPAPCFVWQGFLEGAPSMVTLMRVHLVFSSKLPLNPPIVYLKLSK